MDRSIGRLIVTPEGRETVPPARTGGLPGSRYITAGAVEAGALVLLWTEEALPFSSRQRSARGAGTHLSWEPIWEPTTARQCAPPRTTAKPKSPSTSAGAPRRTATSAAWPPTDQMVRHGAFVSKQRSVRGRRSRDLPRRQRIADLSSTTVAAGVAAWAMLDVPDNSVNCQVKTGGPPGTRTQNLRI